MQNVARKGRSVKTLEMAPDALNVDEGFITRDIRATVSIGNIVTNTVPLELRWEAGKGEWEQRLRRVMKVRGKG